MIKKNNGTTSISLTSEDFRRMEQDDFVNLKKAELSFNNDKLKSILDSFDEVYVIKENQNKILSSGSIYASSYEYDGKKIIFIADDIYDASLLYIKIKFACIRENKNIPIDVDIF